MITTVPALGAPPSSTAGVSGTAGASSRSVVATVSGSGSGSQLDPAFHGRTFSDSEASVRGSDTNVLSSQRCSEATGSGSAATGSGAVSGSGAGSGSGFATASSPNSIERIDPRAQRAGSGSA